LSSPSSVAIHNDSDVFGNLVDHFSNDKERYPDRKSKCGNNICGE
jgi:hypothetical protein